MMKYCWMFLLILFFYACSPVGVGAHPQAVLAPSIQQHEALFTHCTSQWSADVVGEVFCAWALEHGYPVYEGERSCVTAQQIGVDYFAFFTGIPRAQAARYCAIFVEQGPQLLDSTWGNGE